MARGSRGYRYRDGPGCALPALLRRRQQETTDQPKPSCTAQRVDQAVPLGGSCCLQASKKGRPRCGVVHSGARGIFKGLYIRNVTPTIEDNAVVRYLSSQTEPVWLFGRMLRAGYAPSGAVPWGHGLNDNQRAIHAGRLCGSTARNFRNLVPLAAGAHFGICGLDSSS